MKKTRSDKGKMKGVSKISQENIKKTLVDDCDRHLLESGKWYMHANGYLIGRMPGWESPNQQFLHRIIMNPPKGLYVDHINGNRLDNRRDNLRIVTKAQNSMNSLKAHRNKKTSKYKGVFWVKQRQCFFAKIKINRKNIYLGFSKCEDEAARIYDAKARELFGEFACLNFPVPGERGAAA